MTEKALQKSSPVRHVDPGTAPGKKDGPSGGPIRPGVLAGISESLAVGLSFFIGFLLQQRLNIRIEPPSYAGDIEMALIGAGMAFSYAFVFVLRRCYMTRARRSRRESISRLLVNISYAYLMELGLLFLIKDSNFAIDKTALLFGYLIGILLLAIIGLVIWPPLTQSRRSEGKKKLIIKGRSSKIIGHGAEMIDSANLDELGKKVETKSGIEIEMKGDPHAPKQPDAGAVIR